MICCRTVGAVKPIENSHMEHFNSTSSDERLSVNPLLSLDHARQTIEARQQGWYQHRPSRSLGQLPPVELRIRDGAERASAVAEPRRRTVSDGHECDTLHFQIQACRFSWQDRRSKWTKSMSMTICANGFESPRIEAPMESAEPSRDSDCPGCR